MDLANKCPGCGDLAIQQCVNEFGDPEWHVAGALFTVEAEPVYICFCPYCGRMLQNPSEAPVRIDFNK